MRYAALMLAFTVLAGCTWETYQKPDGSTALRQKYEAGTPVYYQDGSYSRNMKYNQYRPEQHAVRSDTRSGHEVHGTTWTPPQSAAE